MITLVYPRLFSVAHCVIGTQQTLCGEPLRQATPRLTRPAQCSDSYGSRYTADDAATCGQCLARAKELGYACPDCGHILIGYPHGATCLPCAAADAARQAGRD